MWSLSIIYNESTSCGAIAATPVTKERTIVFSAARQGRNHSFFLGGADGCLKVREHENGDASWCNIIIWCSTKCLSFFFLSHYASSESVWSLVVFQSLPTCICSFGSCYTCRRVTSQRCGYYYRLRLCRMLHGGYKYASLQQLSLLRWCDNDREMRRRLFRLRVVRCWVRARGNYSIRSAHLICY